jgi:hypothetical protein
MGVWSMAILRKRNRLVSFLVIILIGFFALYFYVLEQRKSDFNFILSYGVVDYITIIPLDYMKRGKNVLNTLEGTFIKDLVLKGPVKTRLTLTEEEMNEIRKVIDKEDILSYPEDLKYEMPVFPDIIGVLTIYKDGHPKTIEWTPLPKAFIERAMKENNKRQRIIILNELADKIRNMIEEKDQYKRLPKAEGGYL